MTYLVIAPDTNQSPGQFPAQANENFLRLKTLINADHVFNDTALVNDGAHRQMTMVNRIDPVGVPAVGTNGMIFTKTPTLPYFWNGTNIKEMTTASFATIGLTTPAWQTIFADPGYEYVGTVTFAADYNTYAGFLAITRVGAPFGNYIANISVNASSQAFQYSGNNLQARGLGNLKYVVQVTRVT